MTSDLQWWSEKANRAPLLTAAQEISLGTAVQAWATHPDGPDHCPAPIRRRGLRARERMVTANLRLVLKFGQKWRTRVKPADWPDLISEGNLGLIEAAMKFDPSKGYRFSTYAWWWVKAACDDWCNRRALMIKPPTTQAPLMQQIRAATRAQGAEGVTREQLAATLGMKVERVAEVLERDQLQTVASFDAHWQHEDEMGSMIDLIVPASAETAPEESAEVDQVRRALARLDTRTAQVVEALHGIDQPAITPAEFAALHGMKPSMVRQIAASGQAQLRDLLRAAAPEPAPRQGMPATAEDFYQPEVMVFAFLLESPAAASTPEQVSPPCRSRIVRRSRVRLPYPELFVFAG